MILAVCGLRQEARIVAGDGVRVIVGGGDPAALRTRLEQARQQPVRGVISIGIAGALSSSMQIGDVVVGQSIIAGAEIFPVDAAWAKKLADRFPQAVLGAITGSDIAIASAADKARLNQANGSCAVDMESQVAACFAQAHGLPFAALRIISDRADQTLPSAALVAMKPDGGIAYGAVLRTLLAKPGQIPRLMETARHSNVAFDALRRCVAAMGPGLGFPA